MLLGTGDVVIGQANCGVTLAAAPSPSTSLSCKTGKATNGDPIDICTVTDADKVHAVIVNNLATGTKQAGLSFDCAAAPTSAKFRVPAGSKYRVVVTDCAGPRNTATFVVRADGAVSAGGA